MAVYSTGNVVEFSATAWQALQDSTNITPSEGVYWHELNPYEGPWDEDRVNPSAEEAESGDKVSHTGSAWEANTTTTEEPGTGSDWDLLVDLGPWRSRSGRSAFWHRDIVVILNENRPPKKYYAVGGTYSISDLDASAPLASVGASWGDYIILANGLLADVSYPRRAWISDVGALTFTTGSSYFDFPEEVLAIMPLSNMILFFGYTGVHIITGDTPPPGGNWSLRKFAFSQGTADSRSVVRSGDFVMWANTEGIFRSDGTTLTDMTEEGGISTYWQDLMRDFSPYEDWRACAGVYRGHYIISIGTGEELITTLVCDLDSFAWFEMSNLMATGFAYRPAGPGTENATGEEELFWGVAGEPRAGKVSSAWEPATGLDLGSLEFDPLLITSFYTLSSATMKRILRAYISYDMRDPANTPAMTVSAFFDPSDADTPGNWRTIGTLSETTKIKRRPLRAPARAPGVGIVIERTTFGGDAKLHSLEIEHRSLEDSL